MCRCSWDLVSWLYGIYYTNIEKQIYVLKKNVVTKCFCSRAKRNNQQAQTSEIQSQLVVPVDIKGSGSIAAQLAALGS